MNVLTRLNPGEVFCGVALNVVVQVALIGLLATVVGRTFARRNAAVRHCILLSALLWIAVSPVAAWSLRNTGWLRIGITTQSPGVAMAPVPVSASAGAGRLHTKLLTSSDVTAPAPAAIPLRPASAGRVDWTGFATSASVVVWGVGVVVFLVRLARALGGVSRLRRGAEPLGGPAGAVLEDVCGRLGVGRRPSLLVSGAVPGPVTIGLMNPVIVLPGAFVREGSPARLREVLTHEVAHVARHDYATGIFQRVVAATLWFHPVVHLLNRELSRAREEVCDNAVLGWGRAGDYARTLLELSLRMGSRETPRLVPGLFGRLWPLEDRVAGILNERRVVMTRVRVISRVVVASVLLAVGISLSAVGATGAQPAPRDGARGDSAPPATGPGAVSGSSGPAGTWLDRGTDYVGPDEEAVRAKEEQGRVAVSKASLSLREAQIKSRSANLEFERKVKLHETKAISDGEVEEAKLAVDLAQVQVQRAEVELEEAKAAAVPTRVIGLTVRDGTRSESDRYNEHRSDSLQTFLERHFKTALDGGWRVTVLRRGSSRPVVIQGFGRETQKLQAGDSVIVRRDLVRVMKDSEVVWQMELKGRRMTLPEALAEAGVRYKTGEPDYRVELTGLRPGTPGGSSNPTYWSADMSSISAGFGKDQVLEPSDVIVLRKR